MKRSFGIAILVLTACASAPGTDEPVEEKRFATGSNIPLRNRDIHVITPEGFENARNSAASNTGRKPGT